MMEFDSIIRQAEENLKNSLQEIEDKYVLKRRVIDSQHKNNINMLNERHQLRMKKINRRYALIQLGFVVFVAVGVGVIAVVLFG